jgi:hypothetical protein
MAQRRTQRSKRTRDAEKALATLAATPGLATTPQGSASK